MATAKPKTTRGDREKILTELRAISYGNLSGFIDQDGAFIRPDDKSSKWKLLKKYKPIKTIVTNPKTGEVTITISIEIEMWNKLGAIRQLAQIEGIDGLGRMIKAIKGAGYDVIDTEAESRSKGEGMDTAKPSQLSLEFDTVLATATTAESTIIPTAQRNITIPVSANPE